MKALLRDESGFTVIRDGARGRLRIRGASGKTLLSLHCATMKAESGQMTGRFVLNDGRVIAQVSRHAGCRMHEVTMGGQTYATVHNVVSRRSQFQRVELFGAGGLAVDWSELTRKPLRVRSFLMSRPKEDAVGSVAAVSSLDGACSYPPMVADPAGDNMLTCEFDPSGKSGKGKCEPLGATGKLDLLLLSACWAGSVVTTHTASVAAPFSVRDEAPMQSSSHREEPKQMNPGLTLWMARGGIRASLPLASPPARVDPIWQVPAAS